MTPPMWARALVAAAAPPRDYESVAGDLCEEYVRIAQRDGRTRADAWYLSQALRSIPALLSYSRFDESPWIRIGVGFFVAFALIAMLAVNELSSDLVWQHTHAALVGWGAWPYFVTGWLDAVVFGFMIAMVVRTHGTRLALIAGLVLVAAIVVPILTHNSSPLSPTTMFLLIGAVPAMCAGAAIYQVLRRR